MKLFRIVCLLLTVAFLGFAIYANVMSSGFRILTVSASRGARILVMRKVAVVIFVLLAAADVLMYSIKLHLTNEKLECTQCGKIWFTKDQYCKKCGGKLRKG